MDKESQLNMTKEIWEQAKGNADTGVYLESPTPEEKLIVEELLKRGVIKRKNSFYYICSETKKFMDNNGKTSYEIEKEKSEQREIDLLEATKEANIISKKSNTLAKWALGLSILAIITSSIVALFIA